MWIQNTAAAIVVYQLTSSALSVGIVSAMQFGSQVLISPWTGALSDRWDRRRMLMAGEAVQFCGAMGLAICIFQLGQEGLPGPWPVYLSTLIIGLGSSISEPASQSLIPSLVDSEDLDVAVGLNAVPYPVARAVGPALGSSVMLAFGAAFAFALNAVSYAIFIALLASIRPRVVVQFGPGRRSIREGFSHVRRDRRTLRLLLGAAGVAVAIDPVLTLSPALAASLGGNERVVGQLMSTFGIGAAVTVVALAPLRKYASLGTISTIGLVLLAAGMGAASFSQTSMAASLSYLISGGGFLLAMTGIATQLQKRIPDALRGRIMALYGAAFLGLRPVAALWNGFLADTFSVRAGMFSATAAALLTALCVSYAPRASVT